MTSESEQHAVDRKVRTVGVCVKWHQPRHQKTGEKNSCKYTNLKGEKKKRIDTLCKLPLAVALASNLRSTKCFKSRLRRLPKCWNMVDPPDSTIFYKKRWLLWWPVTTTDCKRASYFVQSTANINGRLLDDIINDFRERSEEIGWIDLWIEKDLWG